MEKLLSWLEQNPRLKKINFFKVRFWWAMLQFPLLRSSLHRLGWFKSAWRNQSIDKSGQPIPWIVYSAIFFLERRINKKMLVFEYGSGNSTLWWAAKCRQVVSVEYNDAWYKKMQVRLPGNCKIIFQKLDSRKSYAKTILQQKGQFDIVVIDGRERVECAKLASQKLSKKGIIIWDNSERQRYATGKKFLLDKKFKELEFKGPVPIDNMLATTSIFYRPDNILNV